jgi:hypothetical protein
MERQSERHKEAMSACHYCGELDAAAKCSKCHSVLYCNRDCQTKDWKVHKTKCPDLAYDYAAAKEVCDDDDGPLDRCLVYTHKLM